MNILISSIIDVNRAANNRLHQFINHLSDTHSITVVCPKDSWRDSELDVERYGANEAISNSTVNCKYLIDASFDIPPTIQEVLSEVALTFESEIDYSTYDVHLDYNTLFLGHAVSRRARAYDIPTVYDLADDLPAMIRDSPQIPEIVAPLASKIGEEMIKRKITNAEQVSYITEGLRQNMGISEVNGTHIPNGVSTELFNSEIEAMKLDGLNTEFIIGYVGVTREWVDLVSLVQATAQVRASGVDAGIVVVGDEGGIDDARRQAEQLEIEDYCYFAGTVPYEIVPNYLNVFDVGTIPFKNGDIAENSLPLKLFEYMACEVPVISSSIPGIENAAGDMVRFADSVEEWSQELDYFAKNPDVRQQIGRDGRKLVEESYSWKSIAEQMEKLLTEIRGMSNENLQKNSKP